MWLFLFVDTKNTLNMKSRRLHYISRITNLLIETNNPKMKVDEIATRLGITKKTIYNYFDSKQQLFECVLDSYLKSKIEETKENLNHYSNPISSLIYIGHSIGPVFRDCTPLYEQKIGVVKTNPMLNIFFQRRQDLVDIVKRIFIKGIREELFESDIDIEIACQVYLSGIETLYRPNGLLCSKKISSHQISQVLYYMLKGNCTRIGLSVLREKVDIKVIVD